MQTTTLLFGRKKIEDGMKNVFFFTNYTTSIRIGNNTKQIQIKLSNT